MGRGGWSSLSRVGSGDGVSCGGRGRGDSRWRVSAGVSTSIGWCWLPRVVSVAWSRGGGAGGLGWVGLDSPDLKNATDPSIEKFGSPGSGAIIGVV